MPVTQEDSENIDAVIWWASLSEADRMAIKRRLIAANSCTEHLSCMFLFTMILNHQ